MELTKLKLRLKQNSGMIPCPLMRRIRTGPKPLPKFLPMTGDHCHDIEIDCKNHGRTIFNPDIALRYALKLMGGRFAFLAEDAAQEAYLLWIKQNGKIHPRRCVLSAVSKIVRQWGLRDAVRVPLDSDNSIRQARRQTGLTISDLPDGLKTVANLTVSGYTTREIAAKTGLHPRDIAEQRHDIGCYLSEHSPRRHMGDRMELAKGNRDKVELDAVKETIETRLCRAWDQSIRQS